MARDISQTALDKLAQNTGVESILIVGVRWGDQGSEILYSDNVIDGHPNVQPLITELSDLDSILAISQNETSDEVSIVLDDVSGALKEILDANDIHLKQVVIYQWFPTIPFEKKFIIFSGKINSPVVWSDFSRTLSFSAITQLEDREIGFSPEEGEFPDLPENLIGKVWPECFGLTVHEEALQIDRVHRGTLGDAVGLVDFTITSKIAAISILIAFLQGLILLWATAAVFLGFIGAKQAQEEAKKKVDQFVQQIAEFTAQQVELSATLAEQLKTERGSFRVIGGQDFPRGFLELDVNGGKFQGSFQGDTDLFIVSRSQHPEIPNYKCDAPPNTGTSSCEGFNYSASTDYAPKRFFTAIGIDVVVQGNRSFIPSGEIVGDAAGPFFAQAGSAVKIASAEPIRYFMSITPGFGGINNTGVLKIAAFSTFQSGERILVDIPENLYTVEVITFGSIRVVQITILDALSKQVPSQENTIYVTFESSVGPNTVDIMKYLIGKYTNLTYDTKSFNKVRGFRANYPMNFCFSEKKSLIIALRELAFMANCAIFLRNEVFHLQYLPEKPTPVHVFDESNVTLSSDTGVQLSYSATEDLVTAFTGTWRAHGAQPKDNKVIQKHNIKKYGIHESSFDFYAYTKLDLVQKSMSYWLVRRSHTWKKLSFKAQLDALNVEVFDGVTLNFSDNFAANGSYTGRVENARYDSLSHTISFEIWTGVIAGEMESTPLAFHKDIDELLVFPTDIDVAKGFDGNDGLGRGARGELKPINPASITVEYKGGDDDPYGWGPAVTQDHGQRKVSDVGDKNPGKPSIRPSGLVVFGPAPPPSNLTNEPRLSPVSDVSFIDIRVTDIVDTKNQTSTTLDTFFEAVKGNKLQGRTTSEWSDGSKDAEFDYKFDDEGGKYGAGTAFLKE